MNKKLLALSGFVLLCMLSFGMFSISLYPFQNMRTNERVTEFKVTGFATKVIIDDNPYFTSPLIIKKPFVAELEPGVYYWKTNLLSKTRNFTIDSVVAINLLKKNESGYLIQNKGNTMIDLIIKNIKGTITGKTILDVDEELEKNLENGSQIIASQK